MTTDNQIVGFDNIYLASGPILVYLRLFLFQSLGKIKFAPSGIAWKDSKTSEMITLPNTDIKKSVWHKVSKGFGIRLNLANGVQRRFDGFPEDAVDEMRIVMERYYNVTLEVKDLSTRGWNWGQTEFQGNNLYFNVQNKEMFEVFL
jgi:structure-specific recognition protein 1